MDAERGIRIASALTEAVLQGNVAKIGEAIANALSKDVRNVIREELIHSRVRSGDAHFREAALQLQLGVSPQLLRGTIEAARTEYVGALNSSEQVLTVVEEGLVYFKIGACYLSLNEVAMARHHWERAYIRLLHTGPSEPDLRLLGDEGREIAARAAKERGWWRRHPQVIIDVEDMASQLNRIGSDIPNLLLGIGSSEVSSVMSSLEDLLGHRIDLSAYGVRSASSGMSKTVERQDRTAVATLSALHRASTALENVVPPRNYAQFVSALAQHPGFSRVWDRLSDAERALTWTEVLSIDIKTEPRYRLNSDLLALAAAERARRKGLPRNMRDEERFAREGWALDFLDGPTRRCVDEVLGRLSMSEQRLLLADLHVAQVYKRRRQLP